MNRSCRPASLASGWLRVISDMRLDEFGDEWPPFEMGCRPGPSAKLLPTSLRFMIDTLAALICLPLARLSHLLESLGKPVDVIPLSHCNQHSFFTMRTDSRDHFGTPLVQRLTRKGIAEMIAAAGLTEIRFSDRAPFWCAVGTKR
jgi:hypothetical protein